MVTKALALPRRGMESQRHEAAGVISSPRWDACSSAPLSIAAGRAGTLRGYSSRIAQPASGGLSLSGDYQSSGHCSWVLYRGGFAAHARLPARATGGHGGIPGRDLLLSASSRGSTSRTGDTL